MTAGSRELVEAGYAWEVADADLLHDTLNLADLGHVLELDRLGVLPAAPRRRLLAALLELAGLPAAEAGYDAVHGELYTSRERFLEHRIGDDAGWLRLGRTRREAVRTALRLRLRGDLLDLVEAAAGLAAALAGQAARQVRTVMPDHTYLQQAQPTTFGHYLLAFADPVLREADRLLAELPLVNAAPAGAGAANGSAVLTDRHTPSLALGFAGPVEHIRDAMWQVDPFLHLTSCATGLVLTQDSLAEDLEIMASAEFGFVELADGHSRPSVLMPQKRNPYALTVVRGSAGVLVGRMTGQLAVAKAPSARSDSLIYLYGEVPRALGLATRVTRLTAAVVRDLQPDAARMRAALDLGFTQAADLADLLVTRTGADYRTAHRVVQAMVRDLHARGGTAAAIDADLLARTSRQVGGRAWAVDPAELAAVLDPDRLVASRRSTGGAAPAAMRPMLARVRRRAAGLQRQVDRQRDAFRTAEQDVLRRARRRASRALPPAPPAAIRTDDRTATRTDDRTRPTEGSR